MIEFGDDVGGEFARNRRQKFGNETDRNKGENVFRIMSLERRKIISFIWYMKQKSLNESQFLSPFRAAGRIQQNSIVKSPTAYSHESSLTKSDPLNYKGGKQVVFWTDLITKTVSKLYSRPT